MNTSLWKIDEMHSAIGFSVRHLVVGRVRGQFRSWTAELAIDESDLTRSSVNVSIEMASVDTGNPHRDAELVAGNFFDATKFPAMTFRSRRVERSSENEYRVVGELTIRGVTKDVTLSADLGGFVVDHRGSRRIGMSATARVKRSEFGMVWNQVLEAGGVAIGDEVDIGIDIEAVAPSSLRASA
jgi:polyisoprenoid-binding protein YceI